MKTPISAFALHIWENLNIHSGVSTERKLNGLKRIRGMVSDKVWYNILQAISDQYHRSNSAQFIHAISHQGSFNAKMEFLANLPGM